ncbi:hypothetical protein B0H16DRAFT_1582407 [Mycena metata]|uniref:Uncharacterized protein n=1 Tax=Mycena metata TaxID=1033252 RepID=A0AAD7I1G8_9AGAR|nr:hypothetical protein B0H16DRAFT_1582407 [Mycena metata]
MCLHDNSATLSARYLNAQLSAMWANAVECVGHEGKMATVELRSDEYEKHKYTRSLAQFHFAGNKTPRGSISKEKLLFDATFGEPHLKFICNHEVALYLKLQTGHFNKVYPVSSTLNAFKSNTRDNVPFEGLEVAFRLEFSRTALSGEDSRIGNGSGHLIQMMILDFSSARMALFKADLPIGTADALEWYLKKYLTFLQNAGHHVRLDLPDFDDDQYKPTINYSLATRALEHQELFANVAVHGVSESSINGFLRETWLDVVSKSQGFCGQPPIDKLSSCLVEIQSTWVGGLDRHFHIKFGPPSVKVLCTHEVVLYFTAAKVHFHESEDFSREPVHSFANWEFAFIVDVIEEKVVGHASSLKLHISTARFCQHLSTVVARDVHVHFTHIIKFFEYHYFELLAGYEMINIFYPGDYRSPDSDEAGFTDPSDDERQWKPVPGDDVSGSTIIVWSEIIKKISLYGFDHINAISEVSINALFDSFYRANSKFSGCLAEWHYGKKFGGNFSKINVKLLSGDKALVTFTVDHGYITLENKRRYDFSSWTISYTVNLKMVDQTDLHCDQAWLTSFAGSVFGIHQVHRHTYATVKHIVLDFANAEYIYKHSSMPNIWDEGHLVAIERLKSFIHYMGKYLNVLSRGGHNIIHSIPIFPHTHEFGLTSASFQVVSKSPVIVTNYMFEHEVPVLMVVGMVCGRLLPVQTIPWVGGWVFSGGRSKSHGTICLSRTAFLEKKLLATLELVNRRTTVIPRFPREGEDEWKVYLTTWADHPSRTHEECQWTKVENSNPSWLEYTWEHRDEWSYEHEGTRHGASGYSVLCHTKNQLCIPTSYRPRSMEIMLRGESVLRLQGKEEKENWSKHSSATWSVRIQINSGPSGLRVVVVEQVQPVFEKSEEKWDLDPHALLEEHLPRVVDIKEVVETLKVIFEGAWEYSCAGLKTYNLTSPAFTPNGDLVVQLNNFVDNSTMGKNTSPRQGRRGADAAVTWRLKFLLMPFSCCMPREHTITADSVHTDTVAHGHSEIHPLFHSDGA